MDTVESSRTMPVVTRRIEITEGPYTGWWAVMQVNPPMRVVQQLSDNITTPGAILPGLIQEWNFVDAAGNPLPITTETIDGELPIDLFRILYKLFMAEVWNPFWLRKEPES